MMQRPASSSSRPTRPRWFAVAVLALSVSGMALVVPAQGVGALQTKPTAAVSLGDSYIAGEGGRWLGNSSSNWGDRRGTDRAAVRRGWRWRYSPSIVYGDTYASGCHRSDVAPLVSADLAVSATINLACSGASTGNVIASASGGVSYRGEDPQVDQLAAVAASHDIDLVVLSVGGNDLGFADIIIDCVVGYVTSSRWAPNLCSTDQGPNVANRLPAAAAGVEQALNDIRATLAAVGDTDYRLVLQSYPTPVPASSEFRYRETGWSRTFTGGCPFWNADADWANNTLVPSLRDALAGAAASTGAEFLDLTEALRGREACAVGAQQGSGDNAEWIRFVNTGLLQGDAGESVHPNALGQQAMGRCLELMAAATPGDYACENLGGGPTEMLLVPGS